MVKKDKSKIGESSEKVNEVFANCPDCAEKLFVPSSGRCLGCGYQE